MERFSIHTVDAKLLDTSIWPDVLRSQLSEKDKATYDTV
jgi:hypothetical protein